MAENKPVILIVDDEREVRLALRKTLERENYSVVEASDGASAIGQMGDTDPAVVISDYRMAGVDGVFVLKKAKSLVPTAKRIMLTGQADLGTVEHAINEGEVHRFLSKPWDTAQLLEVIRSAVAHRELALENERLLELTKVQNKRLTDLAQGLESKIEERTGLLIRAKRAWEKTFDAIVDPFALIDESLCLVRGNIAWAREVGVDIRSVPGMHYGAPFGLEEEPADCPVRKTFETRQEATAEISNQDESKVFRVWTFYMGEDGGGTQRPRVVCHYKDVTDEVSMQRQLVQSEKLAAVGQLAGGVAHEINNPLSAIIAFTQLGLRDVPETEELHEFLLEVEQAALRCKEIVQNLLTFSRSPQRNEVGRVDLNHVVERAVALTAHEFAKGQVALEAHYQDGIPGVVGNANQLMQVVVNFLTNAKGAIEGVGKVGIFTQSDEETCRVVVRDTGTGLDEGHLEKIFEPFFTTKEEGKGTGLGLSVSYGIVQEHQGVIEACNRPEGGAEFQMVLPRGQA